MNALEHDKLFEVEQKIGELLYLLTTVTTEVLSETVKELEILEEKIHLERYRHQQKLLTENKKA
jgi:hypothetical protein